MSYVEDDRSPEEIQESAHIDDGTKPTMASDRCPRCGSDRWVSASFNGGFTIRAQCVPCGKSRPIPEKPTVASDESMQDAREERAVADPGVELAARMPWTVAEPETWWEVSGTVNAKHMFDRCVARVLPQMITGTEEPLFEVLVYGGPLHITASAITRARQLELVDAAEWDRLQELDRG